MKVDPDGKAQVGTRRNMLGVRPTAPASADPNRRFDVAAVNDADTVSAGEGLSTSQVTANQRVGRGEALFVIETDELPPELGANPDHPPHCLLEPSRPITLGAFQQALTDTRDLWEQVQ